MSARALLVGLVGIVVTASGAAAAPIVFNGENNRLSAYDPLNDFRKQIVIHKASEGGLDMNGQICFEAGKVDGTPDGFPGKKVRRFIAGEDTGQSDELDRLLPHWGYFELLGERVGELEAKRIGTLTPTYQGSADNAENYGCGFLSDGRLVTTDVGNQSAGDGTGQLIVWFPALDALDDASANTNYCKVDIALATGGGIWVDSNDDVYVATQRPPDAGIWRYRNLPGPPANPNTDGDCGTMTDGLLAGVTRDLLILWSPIIPTPSAVVGSPDGESLYVSSVLNGTIAEYDKDTGDFIRLIAGPWGPVTGPFVGTPVVSGNPLGIGIDSRGNLYYADIGLLTIMPGVFSGTTRRIRFDAFGNPRHPETMDRGLLFPDGIGVLEGADCGWPMYGRDPGHSFAQDSDCSGITPGNVAGLRVKWAVPTLDSVSASPSVVDGTVYVGSWDGTFYAIDAETGAIKWTFGIDDDHNVAFGRIVSSAAVATIKPDNDKQNPVSAVLFGGGATLYALDPATGSLLAKVNVDPRATVPSPDPDQVEIESSPAVVRVKGGLDRVFVGMDVHNGRGVGRTGMLALKLKKNAPVSDPPYRFELDWKFDPERQVKLASLKDPAPADPENPEPELGFGCGGVWSSPAVDPKALPGNEGLVFFGTSNCEHHDDSAAAGEIGREGVFAVNAKTGEMKWKFNPRGPNDVDDDFGSSPNLLPAVPGHPEGLVGIGGKDGWYYAFNRETGAEVWRTHVGQSGHAATQIAIGGIIGTPAVGEAAGEPAIFINTAISTPIGTPIDTALENGDPASAIDESLGEDPARMLSLHAISAADGRILWRALLPRQAYGSPTYARGVVFVPSTTSFLIHAIDADTGNELWAHPVNGAPSSAPAIVGDSIYLGVGTRDTDAEFKLFSQEFADAVRPVLGADRNSRQSGIWAFELLQP